MIVQIVQVVEYTIHKLVTVCAVKQILSMMGNRVSSVIIQNILIIPH